MKKLFRFAALVALGVTVVFNLMMERADAKDSAESAYEKGANYLKQNKLDDAIRELSKAIELKPSDKAYYDRARAYEAKGQTLEALEGYTRAIYLNSPETIQAACNNRGRIYEAKGFLDKAIADYTKGIEAMPNPKFSGFRHFKQVLHRNRAEAYLKKEEYEKALEDVRSIEGLGGSVEPEFLTRIKNKESSSPNSKTDSKPEKYPGASSEVNLYNSRGYQSFKKGEYDLAIADYNRALEIDPTDSLVYANRANAYAANGKMKEAIADYNKALEIDPNDYKVAHDLGLTYMNIRQHDKALFYFNKALEINPEIENDGQFHNDRGVAYFFTEDYDKCWKDVNKALELGYRVHPELLQELRKATGRER